MNAAFYEGVLVPRLFTPWAELLCERLAIRSGDHVLDVATGTGAVAQVASAKAGPSGSVTGVDLNRDRARMPEVVTESLTVETVDGVVRSHAKANIAVAQKR